MSHFSKAFDICYGVQLSKFVRYQTSISATILFLDQHDNGQTPQYVASSPILNFSAGISFLQPRQIYFRGFVFIAF
jgi:hypothetical protein